MSDSPVALISSLLHLGSMVGYNRYSVSLGRALDCLLPDRLTWVPLPEGVSDPIRKELVGVVASPVSSGYFQGKYRWRAVERSLRPVLWHTLTDLPVPWRVSSPVVVTCHGLPRWLRHRHMVADKQLPGTFWDYQDFPPSWGARRAMASEWLRTRLGFRRAAAIITDSEYGRWELVNKFGIDPAKVTVVHLGPDVSFTRYRTPNEIEAVRAKYSLPARFVLGVASFSATKNTKGLIKLAAALAASPAPLPMVLVGPAGLISNFDLGALAVGKNLFVLSNIPDDDLACVYRAADVFLNLAWEETFGLPIVEAMASGIPVIGSNRTAVPEVVGEGGLIVDPENDTEVYRVTHQVLTDPELRANLSSRASKRSLDFSWAKAARETVAVYQRVLGARGLSMSR